MASIMGRFSMSREIYRTGVSVHIIEPGYFRTTIVDEERLREYFQMRYDTADPEVKEYYGKDYLEGLQETTAKLLGLIMSPKIHKVVDAYEHAVLAKFPKPRYVVGLDANILFRLLWHLPEWLSDYLVSRPMPLPQGAL
ncbi:DR9C7-like protein [Mya arenaria]|uniref:DR9C7-like protein n=1 Tax=Mya arenaria TaxID=6604 RepID=A0ABY7FZ09_MYAAR|nr:DR9C7-like protein [Mya arenaria]